MINVARPELVFLNFGICREPLMRRDFSKWGSDILERYLFFEEIVLENKVSHICVEPNVVLILWLVFSYTNPKQ